MKFQAELVDFQDQLENRVLCKTFSSRQNSEVQPSVTKIEELKNTFECHNYLLFAQILCKQCKYNYANKHETPLVISITDSFCAQLKLFCETFISSEYFQVV